MGMKKTEIRYIEKLYFDLYTFLDTFRFYYKLLFESSHRLIIFECLVPSHLVELFGKD